ncbi:hypothetical protein AVEN_224033-1 [Araneus ventricosus]|uniref:Uncharacterized protein n=1 Tax=Araneus ventricosus TaxID=182803 RepID=A0A4Y2NK69_ARAVE|nr:hypothetical protein AVEN_224033-1 [Araneus ventricosus]
MSLPLASKSAKFLLNQESFQLVNLTSTPSSGRQRSSSTSPIQPSSTSIVSAIYNCPPIVKDVPIQDLLQNLRNIINGGTTTTTRGDNSKYKAHMSIEIASELTKLVETLKRRFQMQQDSQPIIPPPAHKDTADIGIHTKIDTTTIETRTEPKEMNLTYAEATEKNQTHPIPKPCSSTQTRTQRKRIWSNYSKRN